MFVELVDGDKVEADAGQIALVGARGDVSVAVKGHLIVVVQGRVPLVSRLEGGLCEVIHLKKKWLLRKCLTVNALQISHYLVTNAHI